jgi:hypothetical protein
MRARNVTTQRGSSPPVMPSCRTCAVNQALGQIMEERQRHPPAIVSGCLLTDNAEAGQDARQAARDEIAILHTDAVLAIYDRVAGLLSQYLAAWGSGTARERGEARSAVEPSFPSRAGLPDLAILTALGRPDELGIYVKGAIATGVSVEEIKEILIHATVYCGTPAGRQAFRAAHEALLAEGVLDRPS